HEAGLAEVADAGAGSGFVESLTEELAGASCDIFRGIERDGGLTASLRKGTFQARVLATRQDMLADAARRRVTMVGVSEFAWLADPPVRTLDCAPAIQRQSGQPLDIPPPGRGERFERLVEHAAKGALMADMHASTGQTPEQ